ncbi:MAG: T9SS type A sorting domain-containing protein [Flavobacteriia bacterium]
MQSGTLNLNGQTLSATGTVSITAGTVQSGTGQLNFTGSSVTFGNGSGGPSVFSSLIVNSASIMMRNSTFHGTVNLTKNDGTATNAMLGGNTFNSTLNVNYISTTGTGYWSFGNGSRDIYNGDVTVVNNSLNRIIFCHNSSTNQFNGNLILSQTGNSVGTSIGWSAGSSATISAGKNIQIGVGGFSTGYLYLQGITQQGSAPTNLTTTGSSSVFIGTGNADATSTFGGAFTVTASNIYVRGGVFNGAAEFIKTGGGDNNNGGKTNTFNSSCTITQSQSSTGFFMLGSNSNDQFNGNIILNNKSSQEIYLGNTAGTGTPTLNSGATVVIGSLGFSSGSVYFCQGFRQLGTTAQNLVLTDSSRVYFRDSCTFNGPLTVSGPNIYFNGGIFNNIVTATKTSGTTSNASTGGNIFNSTFTLNYTSTSGTGYWSMGNGTSDWFKGDVYSNNNSQGRIFLAHTASSTLFDGNLILSQTGNSVGTSIGWNAGSAATISAGKNIQIGNEGFSVGYLYLQGITQQGSAPINLTTTGSSSVFIGTGNADATSTFGGAFTVTSPNIYFNGGIFSNTVTATKTSGTSSNASNGGNIFNSTFTLNYTSTSGTGVLSMGNGTSDWFKGDVYSNNNSQGRIFLAHAASSTLFDGNLILSQTGNSVGTSIGWNAGSAATISATKNIQIGSAGFNTGYLYLQGVTQLGTVASNLTLTGNSSIFIGFGNAATTSTFGGAFTVTAPDIYVRGGVFNGAAEFNKTGGTNNTNSGNANTFNATCTINQTATSGGDFTLGNNTNDQFNGNIILSNVASIGTADIYLGLNSGSPTLANTRTITIGSAGFSFGSVYFRGFQQTGSTAQSLAFTGTAAVYFDNNAIINSALTLTAPNIYFNGATFNGAVVATKTSGSQNTNTGGNTFNGNLTLNYTSSSGTGYWSMANSTRDIYNADVYLNNNSLGRLTLCENTASNLFNGNVIISQSGSSVGTTIGWTATASCVIAPLKNIQIGAGGFSAGYLYLQGITQQGSAPTNITTTGSSSVFIGRGNAPTTCIFGGAFTVTAPDIYVRGGVFNGAAEFNKTGGGTNTNDGNLNTFNSTCTINQRATSGGDFILGHNTSDQFNGNIILTNVATIGTADIFLGYNSGTPTLANTKTVTFGGAGFSIGALYFRGFQQIGATAQSLTLTGTAAAYFDNNATFNAALNLTSPNIFFNGAIFNGPVEAIKNGTVTNSSSGGNTFNSTSKFTSTGTSGAFRLANTNADTYVGNVIFEDNNSGSMQANYTSNCIYQGDITVLSSNTSAISFGANGGTVTLSGGLSQTINKSGNAVNPTIPRLVVNKSANNVSLNVPITISTALTLSAGKLILGTHNLTISPTGSASGGNTSSYVVTNSTGLFRRTVANSSTFYPIGNSSYNPAWLNNAGTSDIFSVRVIDNVTNNGTGVGTTTSKAVVNRTWHINEVTAGGSNVTITLGWNSGEGINGFNEANAFMSHYISTAAMWDNIGGAVSNGSITSAGITNFSPFTVASDGSFAPLPVELISFQANCTKDARIDLTWSTASEHNTSFFRLDRSRNGSVWDVLGSIEAAGNSTSTIDYSLTDDLPYSGLNYYRLVQFDIDGMYTTYDLQAVLCEGEKFDSNISSYPNPSDNSFNINVLSQDMEGDATMFIYSIQGAVVYKQTVHLQKGNNTFFVSDNHLFGGTYLIAIQQEEKIITTRHTIH